MRFGKFLFTVFVFAACFLFFIPGVYAQKQTSSKQIRILNNYGYIPFEDGKTVIADVVFTGLDSDYEQYDEAIGIIIRGSECYEMLEQQRATIKVDDKFHGYKVAKVVKLLREWLANYGYDRAEIIALGEVLPKNRMKLVFSVMRGELARVSEIRFDGNVNVSTQELVENFKNCIEDGWKIYDQRKYEYISRKCTLSLMFSKGFFQAKVKPPTRKRVENGYIVTIEIEEGVRYRYGEIKIKNATVFSEKEILEMLEQKSGDVANGKELQAFIYEKLKKVYGEKGYVLYNAEFDPEFVEPLAEGLDATVNVLITIDEGKAFQIGKIEFVGVDEETAKDLMEKFPLKKGEIFNQSKLEEGIKKINDTEEFYFIDEGSIELRTEIETEQYSQITDEENTAQSTARPTLRRRLSVDEIETKQELGRIDLKIKLRKIQQ